MHMNPVLLFDYLAAVAGGLFLVGLSLFVLFVLFVGVVGWAKKPAMPEKMPDGTTVLIRNE